MNKYVRFMFLIFLFTLLFTALLGCKSNRSPLVTSNNIFSNTFDPDSNLQIINNLNDSLNNEEDDSVTILEFFTPPDRINITDETEADSMTIEENLNLPYENYTNTNGSEYNCTDYRENFKPHFLIYQSMEESYLFRNNNISKHLYYFSPLFQHFTLKKMFELLTSEDLRDIKNSYQKSYNITDDIISNFDPLLNHYARILTEDIKSELGVDAQEVSIIEITLSLTYFVILSRFFEDPYGNEEIDSIVFNIIIPFRDKVRCILFDKTRHRYCRECLNELDVFKCCSFEFYDPKDRMEGELFIKNAAQAIHWQLKQYIGSKEPINSDIVVDCFYDEFTIRMCQKIKKFV